MADEKLNDIWKMAEQRAAAETDRIAKMRESDEQRHLDKCRELEELVWPRLEQAKEAWKEKAVVDIGKQFQKSSSGLPSISLTVRLLKGGGRSSCYFFTVLHDGEFSVYESATLKNYLGSQIGLIRGKLITEEMIDKVLGIALDTALKRAEKPKASYALP